MIKRLGGLFRKFIPVPHRDLSQDRIEVLLQELLDTRANGSRLIIRVSSTERVVQFRLEGLPEQRTIVSWFPPELWSGAHSAELTRFLEDRGYAFATISDGNREFVRLEFGENTKEAANFALKALVELLGCDPHTEAVARLYDLAAFGP